MKATTWDWKDQPPWEEITKAVIDQISEGWRLHGYDQSELRLIQVDSGSDQWAVVITCGKETDVDAQRFYEASRWV